MSNNFQQENLPESKNPSLLEGQLEDETKLSLNQLGLSKLYEYIGAPIRLPEDPSANNNHIKTVFNMTLTKLPETISAAASKKIEKTGKKEPLHIKRAKTAKAATVNGIDGLAQSPSSQTLFNYYPKEDPRLVYLRYKDQGDWEMKTNFYASYLVNIAALIKTKNPKLKILKEKDVAAETEKDFQSMDTLKFNSLFESGNLYAAFKVSHNEYDLILQNDINTRGHTQWFFFSVANAYQGQKVKFNIVNLIKPDSLFNEGLKPAVFSTVEEDAGWKRAGSNVSYFKNHLLREGGILRPYYTLTFTHTFNHDNDTVYFAHSFPYTYTDLKSFLGSLTNDPVRKNYIIKRSLCTTLAKNECEYLSITSPSNPDTLDQRYGIVITARQHPGESLASYIMEGFIDFVTSEAPEAQILRELCIFKIVPMLNPDGVIHGNYRTSLAGRDLNRIWNRPRPSMYPTIYHTKELIRRVSEKRPLHLVCDLHGHSRKKNAFFYGNATEYNPYTARIFPLIMSKISKYVSFEDSRFMVQKSKENTARIALWRELNIQNVFTLEASFYGYEDNGGIINFTTADYRNLGADLAKSILVYLNQIVLPKEEKPFFDKEKFAASKVLKHPRCENVMEELRENKQLIEAGNRGEDSGSDTDNSDEDIPVKELNKMLPYPEPIPKPKKKVNSELPPKKKIVPPVVVYPKKEERHVAVAFGQSAASPTTETPPIKQEKPRQDVFQAFTVRAKRLRKVTTQMIRVPLARSRFLLEELQQEGGNSDVELIGKAYQTEGDEEPSVEKTQIQNQQANNLGDTKYWLYQDKTPKAKYSSPNLIEKGGLFVVGPKAAADITDTTFKMPRPEIPKAILSKLQPSVFQREMSRSQTSHMAYRQTPDVQAQTSTEPVQEKLLQEKRPKGTLRNLTHIKPAQLLETYADLRIGFKAEADNTSPIKDEKEISERRKSSSQKILENKRITPTDQTGRYRLSTLQQKPLRKTLCSPSPIQQFVNSLNDRSDSKEILPSELNNILNNSKKVLNLDDGTDDSFYKTKLSRVRSQGTFTSFPNLKESPEKTEKAEKAEKKRERIIAALTKGFYVNNRFQENPNSFITSKEFDVSPLKTTAIKPAQPALYNEFRSELENKIINMGLIKPKVDKRIQNHALRKIEKGI